MVGGVSLNWMSEDESHLNGLAVAHYAVGGVLALFACLPLIHTFLGLALILGVGDMQASMAEGPGGPPPVWFGWLFFLMGFSFFLGGQALAVSVILSGRFLKQQRRYWFSFVVACIACAFMPFGTVLGVLTIIVLSRESVKVRYGLVVGPPPLGR